MSKTVEIKNNKPRLYTMNEVTLQPGLNKLPAEKAEQFLAHPHAQIKVERGIFEVKGESKPAAKKAEGGQNKGEEDKGGQPTAAELIAIIEETEDRELLATAAGDERVTVKRAAEARLAELDAGGQE